MKKPLKDKLTQGVSFPESERFILELAKASAIRNGVSLSQVLRASLIEYLSENTGTQFSKDSNAIEECRKRYSDLAKKGDPALLEAIKETQSKLNSSRASSEARSVLNAAAKKSRKAKLSMNNEVAQPKTLKS